MRYQLTLIRMTIVKNKRKKNASIFEEVEKLEFICTANRNTREGNGNSLQHSCLENPVDGGAWWAAVHRVAQSDTTEMT